LLLQGAIIIEQIAGRQPDTVTAPQLAGAPTPANAPHAQIRFSPQATSAEILTFLNAHSAEVVLGPIRNGFFDIRFTGEISKDEIVRKVQRMQSETKVVEFIATKQQ